MGLLRKRTTERDDRKFVGRTSDPIGLEIIAAFGSRLVDERGRSYIDFESGWCVGNLGWNHPALVERLRAFAGPSYLSPHLIYEPWIELAKQLAELAPGNLTRTFRAVGGTEAVEHALQLAIAATGRHRFVSIAGAYHGNSIAARSLGGEPHLGTALPGCRKLAPPLDGDALARLEALLEGRDVAALVMEPIAINLGVEVPTDAFLRGARELCDRFGTLLVFDEVACGFGRTGRLFAAEHTGVTPDIMTLGKAITNGHAPLAATMTTAELADEARGKLDFYSTFAWTPLAVEAALAVLGVWRDEGATILDNVERREAEILSRLVAMPWRREAHIRAKGLAIAVELDATYATEIAERARDGGLLLSANDDFLEIFPPLTIGDADASDGLDILERAVTG